MAGDNCRHACMTRWVDERGDDLTPTINLRWLSVAADGQSPTVVVDYTPHAHSATARSCRPRYYDLVVVGYFYTPSASRLASRVNTVNSSTEMFHERRLYLASTVWVKKNPPPEIFWHFIPNGWEFFVQILHACYMFLPTLDYKFLFNYLQLWRSYAILSATT